MAKLAAAVEAFDRSEATRLCDLMIAGLHEGRLPAERTAKKALQALRRKCYFELMERLAEALRYAGCDGAEIRRQHAQALIDQKKISPAVELLEGLIARTAEDPIENAEARGLLGRAFKQLYVDAVNADPGASRLWSARRSLQRAVDAYAEAYRSRPEEHIWHGINTVALVCRARRDGVELAGSFDAERIARDLLELVGRRARQGAAHPWDLATAAEASVALGAWNDALGWIAQYVQRQDADAFELSSTERQLREVWGLTPGDPSGSLLLPLLQAQILRRRGGQVELATGTLDTTMTAASGTRLEKVLGHDGVKTLGWYRRGLERCQTVAQVRTPSDEGFGTGFLVRGGDFHPSLGEELLLLTNAHVVSDDPRVRDAHRALAPDEAKVSFEAPSSSGSADYAVAKVVWTSRPEELDATLLRLDRPVAAGLAPWSKRLPLLDGQQRVYVIGHPGGRTLSLSLHDNVLLDYDERLLHYRAPTEGGSSGSPVYDQEWRLIGLHHAGGLQMPCLNGKTGTYPANEGIYLKRLAQAAAASLA